VFFDEIGQRVGMKGPGQSSGIGLQMVTLS
jgi:hypothetical protein